MKENFGRFGIIKYSVLLNTGVCIIGSIRKTLHSIRRCSLLYFNLMPKNGVVIVGVIGHNEK